MNNHNIFKFIKNPNGEYILSIVLDESIAIDYIIEYVGDYSMTLRREVNGKVSRSWYYANETLEYVQEVAIDMCLGFILRIEKSIAKLLSYNF